MDRLNNANRGEIIIKNERSKKNESVHECENERVGGLTNIKEGT